jgi:phospholipase C
MGDAGQHAAHIKDATDLYVAIQAGTLPAVSFIEPDGLLDGHPASSKLDPPGF